MEAVMLGDCLLHLDHHEMTGECWNAAIGFFADAYTDNPDITNGEVTRLYKATYERALLDQHRESLREAAA